MHVDILSSKDVEVFILKNLIGGDYNNKGEIKRVLVIPHNDDTFDVWFVVVNKEGKMKEYFHTVNEVFGEVQFKKINKIIKVGEL